VSCYAGSEPLERVAPEDVGIAPDRLERLCERLRADVERGEIHGAVALVARDGRLALAAALGTLDGREPMPLDAIFRVYSLTKPIVSLAALLLQEEGALMLSDPVEQHLPALGEMRVLAPGPAGERGETVPAERSILVHDLLRHTAGLSGGERGTPAVRERYAAAGMVRYDHTEVANEHSSEWLVERLGEVPLAHQPGTVWEYSRAGDVLGRLVEVVSGRALDELCRERIFEPLGMRDSGWHVEPAELGRVARPCPHPAPSPMPELVDWTSPPRCLSGGSGAFSTALDYLRFASALLERGRLGDVRIASPATVALMASDHIGALRGTGPDYLPGPGYGFGLGVAVRDGHGGATYPGSPGDFWWLGRAGTSFFVDPRERLVGVLMTQRYWRAVHYQRLFRTLVYQALVD
jgi:CubicO group peptidase (beta-lactamase class C family)